MNNQLSKNNSISDIEIKTPLPEIEQNLQYCYEKAQIYQTDKNKEIETDSIHQHMLI